MGYKQSQTHVNIRQELCMTDFTKIKKLFNITGLYGFEKSELQLWIVRYGAIPRVLLDYYVELGAYKPLNETQDFLITPNDIQEFDDPNYLIFYSENQSVSFWGINKSDVIQDNPPVYENYGGIEWYKTCDTLLEFLTSMAFFQAVFSMKYSNLDYRKINQEDVDNIKKIFISKDADSGIYTGVKFFGNYNDSVIAILNDNNSYNLLFSSNSEAHFEEMNKILTHIL